MSDLEYRAVLAQLSHAYPEVGGNENFSEADLEILHAISSARSSQSCNETFRLATKRYGVDVFASGEVDVKNRDRNVFYSMEWSESWRRFYLANFLQRDPMLGLLEHTDEPFTWGEWRGSSGRLSTEEQEAFALVESHGWIDGFVLPMPRAGTHVALVSLVFTQPLDPAADKPFLTHASFCYLQRIRSVITPRDFPVPPLGLAPRELECLGLVARGYADRRIAEELGHLRLDCA